jgi:hypothetical protein
MVWRQDSSRAKRNLIKDVCATNTVLRAVVVVTVAQFNYMIINCLENLSSKLRTLLSLVIELLSQDINVNVNKLSDVTNVPRSCELPPTDADA